MESLKEFKSKFDPLFVEQVTFLGEEILLELGDFRRVPEIVEYLVMMSRHGKRIRPWVIWNTYQSNGGTDWGQVESIMIAIEMFHLFALIHDDIMDNAEARHGMACLHKMFSVNDAMLIGDMCLSYAYRHMDRIASRNICARKLFMRMAHETIVGQMGDEVLSGRVVASSEALGASDLVDKVHELKTAKYTFVYPMLLGCSIAGAPYDHKWELLGNHLGRAFQIVDDVMDIMGTREILGKEPFSDLKQGKNTRLVCWIMDHGTDNEREQLREWFGNASHEIFYNQEGAQVIRDLFVQSGAVNNEIDAIECELVGAVRVIEGVDISDGWKDVWRGVVEGIREKIKNFL